MNSSRQTLFGLAAAAVIVVGSLSIVALKGATASPDAGSGQAAGGLVCWSRTIIDERNGITCDEACASGGAACTGVNTGISPSGCDVRTGGPATCRCCKTE